MAAAAERPSAGGFVLWLHGSGGSGDESRQHVAPYFSDPGIVSSVRLSFPTAPTRSIPCYGCNLLCCFALWLLCKARDAVITAWFGISEVPITAKTVRDEKEVLKAVEYVHELLDKEVAAGTSPSDIFVCGMSQGGGCAVFSGSVPLNKSFAEKVSPEATKTPVLWFHGMADGLVLFEAGHAGCAFLEELGMSCEFKAYPTLGHSLVDEELQYFQQWILNRLGMAASGATETARPSSSSNHKDLQ
ncbi:probable carboxylesterase Os04g0669600 isoform X2 [Sorghum bicolor]|uniref:probable carboxylesterase Os04g0669600 isoform X2 n=1 Tax=Sorghum bicolor TaxID=4558 RepID=UPI00081AE698|nr:probable carboxylesterase Os04g0669600 isoform X2 [Sorghum bicolor]|eukprot:XP_021318350.1 probable carboxylesterase Os04g0669600 isoform X2 [Sorghum bicolor]